MMATGRQNSDKKDKKDGKDKKDRRDKYPVVVKGGEDTTCMGDTRLLLKA